MGLGASKTHIVSGTMSLDEFRWRWAAPELQRPDEYDLVKVVATKPSDIYGMGMVIYEVRFLQPICFTLVSHLHTGSGARAPLS